MNANDFSFPASQRLKHKKLFEELFASGKRILKHPVLTIHRIGEQSGNDESIQVGFSVPKKHYKTAVERNRIKRWYREAFRQENKALHDALQSESKTTVILFITLKADNISYEAVRAKMVLHLQAIEREVRNAE